MREIKFRAWDKWEKKWVEKNLILLIPSGELRELTFDGVDFADDDRYELVQYTGLEDKNGKEIYEGDIMNLPPNEETDFKGSIGIVEWGNDYWCFGLTWKEEHNSVGQFHHGFFISPQEYEIIGDVYENPELLEKKDGR